MAEDTTTTQVQGEGLKYNLQQLLRAMVEKGASDMHITAGSPPVLRIDGSVVPLKLPPLSKNDTKQLCYEMLTEEQRAKFEANNELDLSFPLRNVSRFRANIYVQRGAIAGAFRQIPFKILNFEELGLPQICVDITTAPARPRAGHWPNRLGQEHHAREHHRPHQLRAAGPHHDDRGPDRVPALAQDVHRQPARGRRRHRVVPRRAQVRPPAGPGRRADRRDAEPRDDRGRADDRRDGPPRLRHPAHQLGDQLDQPHHRRLPAARAVPGARAAPRSRWSP